jgi:tRNA threonylcarbamoyladenosine biosynthesis protein TsaE
VSASLEIFAPAQEDTAAVGARLARACPLEAGRLLVAQLHGALGAGKTTLARGFLQALGVTGPVRSPTYTLVELYELPAPAAESGAQPGTAASVTAVHLDLYRLADPAELELLGLADWAGPRHVWLIEWPEKGGGRTPAADLHITLTAGEAGHHIAINAATPLGERWIERLR